MRRQQEELRDAFTPAVADAWRALFAYVIGQLKDGYEDEWRRAAISTQPPANATANLR